MKKVWELPPGTAMLGVGSSAGPPFGYPPRLRSGLRQNRAGFLEKREKGRTPRLFRVNTQRHPRYSSSLKWSARPLAYQLSAVRKEKAIYPSLSFAIPQFPFRDRRSWSRTVSANHST